MSPTPDRTLTDPQQIIAELQKQLAEAVAERDEAQVQKAAIAEILDVINFSAGDPTPVFEAILDKAHALCHAGLGSLVTYDGEFFHVRAAHGYPPEYAALIRQPSRPPRNSPFERLVRGEPLVHITDATSLSPDRDDNDPLRRAAIEIVGIRTALFIPLRKDGVLLGYISAQRKDVQPFSDKQIALLQNFAAQAVIAMENARLLTETREALEQQTATAEILEVINRTPGDLAPVFDAILEKAHSLCGAAHGTLVTYDGEHARAVATHGVAEPLAGLLRQPFRPLPDGPLGRLVREQCVIHIPDQAAEAQWGPDDPKRIATAEGGVRTMLFVPLRKGDLVLGWIAANRLQMRPFTDKEIALLENFAAQAVIAMENAHLITETREALEQQTATAEVLGVINASPGDLAPVFDAILDRAQRVCGVDHAALELLDGERFHAVAVHGASDKFAETLRRGYRAADSPAGQALLEGQRFAQIADAAQIDHIAFRTAAELDGIRTVLFVPLRRDDALLGMIASARRQVRLFSEKEIALLENFAAQAVIAIENARLITETREALEQQTATAEVLQVINASPGELEPVFDSMVERAARLCEADEAALRTFDGELLHLVAVHGSDPEVVERLRQLGPTRAFGLYEGFARGESVVHFTDVRETAIFCDDPVVRERLEIRGIRSWLAVALHKEGVLQGVINVHRHAVRPFTDKQIALLQNFAAQAVIAMENARLLGELRQRTDEVGELNRDLEARVAAQVDELGRVGRLKRFLAPQLAELIVSQGDEKILESHRREIVVVFCDLRGYTAFTETAEPEEVLDFLRQYHGALGPLISQFEGTLDQFSGDGIMVFFNDPVPCPDPAERAVKMAMAMREVAGKLIAAWRRRGRMLGFGAGIAQGYATLGQIGFADRSGYTAIGTVCNLAARLCAEAKDGQILIAQLVAVAVEETTPLEEVSELTLKGLTQPVVAYNVPLQAAQPALRVIEGGGPQSV